uniref:Uncharacterized protein n=1 Tax=Rhizophora mucronata TaxID=61149 RepID=A0A2P2IXG0_RHIMU
MDNSFDPTNNSYHHQHCWCCCWIL